METADAAGVFGLGCVSLGHPSAGGSRQGVRLVHQALDLGVRLFDTADSYGSGASERVLGRALRHRRDEALVATKVGYMFRPRSAVERVARRAGLPVLQRARESVRRGEPSSSKLTAPRTYASQDFSPKHVRTALEASLRRLDTDYVDVYQLHSPPRVCEDDVLALMLDLRSTGKIRAFGVGLGSLEHAMTWLGTGALSSIQVPFGVLDPEAGDEVIPTARTRGVAVVVRGVFAGGFLVDRSEGDDALLRPGQPEVRSAVRALASSTGVDALQIAAWFVTSNRGVTNVLVGTSSARHLEQSLRYVAAPPPDDMLPRLAALVAAEARRDDP